jgi:N-acetylglutamate synthase-like GNAT family acetyltransferase
MTSTHLYYAEKSDIESIYELAIEYKNVDLLDADYPDIDRNKLINFINTMLKKGKIMLMKDLDKDRLIACCMFNKSEYFFSKTEIMQIQIVYVKKDYRNFNLVKTLIDSVKKQAEGLPLVLSITSGLGIDPVFEKLGFKNMGSNWRYI